MNFPFDTSTGLSSISTQQVGNRYRGIVLAGGSGSRLHPVTMGISKQLAPVYDKPMIYYPISALMLAGIRDILIVTTPHDIDSYKRLLNDGGALGCSFSYAIQEEPKGLAQALTIGANFIGDKNVALILGDNLFHGGGFSSILDTSMRRNYGASIFGVKVNDPHRYGVVETDANGTVISIEEKPRVPKSNLAVAGLYLFDNRAIELATRLEPSARGEYEITDLINAYIDLGDASLNCLPRGLTWLDTGTHESMMQASQYVYAIESRTGVKIACLEEIALANGWIGTAEVEFAAKKMGSGSYANYLRQLCDEAS